MNEPIVIFKCPCEGNKYKFAGEPNDKPTLKEKREYSELINQKREELEQLQNELSSVS